ncbi:WASH complex subunit 2-like [Ctenocephalides felis]|uniref:WASH complex subunit 2-like n=1 Tax=Ctenocephalides felis TaxID=7515 RepID=UPI000E6E5941|nr:WASH complex subunit 2-like [Ctenocephalides felis]
MKRMKAYSIRLKSVMLQKVSPVEAKSNSDLNVKFADTNRAAANPITDIFNESEDDDDLFQVKPKVAPPKSINIDSKSEDKKLLQSSMIINKFTYLAAGSENKLKDSQAQSKTMIPNTTDVEQESIKAPPTSEAISKSPKLFEESTSDLSDDDDLFKIGSTKTVISKSSNDDVKNTLSSNASHQKTDLFAEPENLLHQNNKLVDHVKTNASSNRTPNIKTKIVGIFEDPIYRDSKTINNSEITNVEVPKTSVTTSIVESSTKAIKEKQELGNSNINDELVKEQREKSLYEQAASNIALFGDEPPIDIFEDLTNSKKSDNSKRITLFDDDEDEPDFFQDLSKTVNNIGTKEPFGIGLFDNEPPDDIDFKTKIKKSYVNTNKNDDKLFASVSNVANKFDQKLIDKNDDSNQVKEVKNENANDIKITSLLPKTNEPKKLSNLSNFNINVSALLPGARPPSLSKKHGTPDTDQSDSKSVTPIPEHDVNLSKKIAVDSRGDGLIHNYKEISNRKIDSDQKERNGDFISQTETLQNSAVKERVRIPQKRRPPSRRARQEAARKSLVLENSDSEIESVSTEQNILSDFAKSMDENEKSLISKNSHIKSANKLTNELSSVINSSSGQPRINDNSSKSSFKEDLTDHSKSENSNSLSKSKSQAISSDHSESGSNIKDGTDILSPSTEEDDIFKIDKIADDDTLKVDEYNSIFNDSDDDVDDLTHDSENKAEVSKTDDIKRQKEFNLLEALTRNTESKPNMDAIDENILKTDSLFIPVDLDINSGVGLKPVPENTNIAGSISQKHSETNITDLKNNSSLSAQESVENDLFGAAASSNNDLEDKLSTLAIDGSAEVLHAAQVGKTSKDILFDSDLEEDLFTAKSMFISKNAQNVSQRGDVKPRSPLLNSVGADDLFAGLPRSNIILRKNRKTDNLFSDTEDDEDLFKVKTIKVSKSSTDKVLSNSKKSSVPKSASLFGDSDDDDDLFKVSTGKYS